MFKPSRSVGRSVIRTASSSSASRDDATAAAFFRIPTYRARVAEFREGGNGGGCGRGRGRAGPGREGGREGEGRSSESLKERQGK